MLPDEVGEVGDGGGVGDAEAGPLGHTGGIERCGDGLEGQPREMPLVAGAAALPAFMFEIVEGLGSLEP